MTNIQSNATLASAIFSKLREEILAGSLTPNSKINIRMLCERFGVAFSPVREALNRLVSQNLVRQSDRRGFTVAPISQNELADITRARCLVNEAALRASIADGDSSWEEAVLLAFHRLLRTPRDDLEPGPSKWTAAHKRFHASLLEGCGSTWLTGYCDQLFDAAERYRVLGMSAGGKWGDADDEHRAIMEAAIDRDAERAVSLLNAHFQKTQTQLAILMTTRAQQEHGG
jgi:GntR family transcriptional regulator, carbon starvation induced regulator